MLYRLITVLILIGLFSPAALADEKKIGHIGAASFATVISNNIAGVDDDEFGGLAIYGGGAFNDNFGMRGLLGFQSHQDVDIDVRAMEVTIQAGTGLATEGFKAYGSAGFFSETWSSSGLSDESFTGGLFGGGIGYNWAPVSLEFWVHIRSTSDYEDALGPNSGVSLSAASAGLGLSGRF